MRGRAVFRKRPHFFGIAQNTSGWPIDRVFRHQFVGRGFRNRRQLHRHDVAGEKAFDIFDEALQGVHSRNIAAFIAG